MAIKTWIRHLRDSFISIWRNRWMSLASVGAVTVTLLLVGVFVALILNVNKIASDFEKDVEVKVLIDTTMKETKALALAQKVKKLPDVAEVRYSSKEDELQKVIDDFGEDLSLVDQENPLHNVLYVKATEPQKTADVARQIDALKGTSEVLYGKGKIDKFFQMVDTTRTIGLVFIVALVLMAVFLISNTIKLTIAARQHEIEIMKLVGATNNYVRVPFMLEGMWLGLFGAVLPIIAVAAGYMSLYERLSPIVQNEVFSFLEPTNFLLRLSVILLAMGVVIGIFGSAMSIRKYLAVK
ncbi:cell division protein FtsX [Kurthia sp. 3B1D]|uniref:Cell division protein FtsX n=1 Tax=Candidatus Kurthia intestinigallinarum TaxID=1562256 RepID=A0A433RTR1_9BACL|nr:permease-like cell division protein FtsX [Kurthia sp. 3B1D]RUS55550.1 cell division protein FtsX [Kurthia sp. 3B1D]